MTKIFRPLLALGFILFVGLSVTVAPEASAQTAEQNERNAKRIADAKAMGIVGEQVDGYLGRVDPNVPINVGLSMNTINGQRADAYSELALKQFSKKDPDSYFDNKAYYQHLVAAIIGEKMVEGAPSGEFVKTAMSYKRVRNDWSDSSSFYDRDFGQVTSMELVKPGRWIQVP